MIRRRTHCKDCNTELDLSNIVWHGPRNRDPRCRECYRIYDRGRYHSTKIEDPNKLRDKWRKAGLKRDYGITVEEYDKMFEFQLGGCAICRQPCMSGQRLAVDHNHKTGEIRGLLCRRCNNMIGFSMEDEDIIWNMLEYLKRTTWSKKIEVA